MNGGILGRGKQAAALAPLLTRRHVLEFTVDVLANARQLLEGARALRAQRLYGPSLALAVAAREEGGKIIFAALYLVGQMDAQTFLLRVRDHTRKQAAGAVATRNGTAGAG